MIFRIAKILRSRDRKNAHRLTSTLIKEIFRRLSAIRLSAISAIAVVFVLAGLGCSDDNNKKVTLGKTERLPTNRSEKDQSLRIAVGSMVTPRAGFAYYKELLDFIGEKIGKKVIFVGKDKYAEVNELLKTGDIDVAFVCSGPYVEAHKLGVELLVVPQAYGEAVYYSYIIVHRDSPIRSFGELRGRTFAFADPDSNSGTIFPTYVLFRMGQSPDSFFSEYMYTYAHDKSIKAVASRLVDGAAVDSLVWKYLDSTSPEDTSRTRVILKSRPFGMPPVVVRAGLETKTKEKLREIFLNVHRDEKGRKILKGMMLDKFIAGDDSAYSSVREMTRFVSRSRGKK